MFVPSLIITRALFKSIMNIELVSYEVDREYKYVKVLDITYTNPIVNGLVAKTSNELGLKFRYENVITFLL